VTQTRCALAALILIALMAAACGAAQPTPEPRAPTLPQQTVEPTSTVSPTSGAQPTGGTASEAQQVAGKVAYEKTCARCHGASLEDGFSPKLSRPVLANYGTALELYEYVRSAMPKGNAGSLPDQEYYDITGYLLFRQGLLPEQQVVDLESAPNIQLLE